MTRPPSGRPAPLFLARDEYRRRRLHDAARLVPVVGALLFLLPGLWQAPAEGGGVGTALGGLYLFAVWAILIVAAAALAPALSAPDRPGAEAVPPGAAPPGATLPGAAQSAAARAAAAPRPNGAPPEPGARAGGRQDAL